MGIIEDPDCEGFTGLYAGGPSVTLPPCEYNLTELARYLKREKKEFVELTKEELEKFKHDVI